MKASVEKPAPWRRVIDVEIPEEEVGSAFEEKLGEYRKSARIPGFRKGKIPETIIKNRYGKAIRAEVIEDLIQKSYENACKDNQITPISEAKVRNIKVDEGAPVRFTIETEVEPEIEVKGYEKLKVKVSPKKIGNGEVDSAIDELRERMAEFKEVDRPAKKGDYITFDYTRVIVDGEEKKNVSSPQYPIEIGASKIKDFDKGLTGCTSGEKIDLTVKFPSDYGDPEMAGKKGDLSISITSVREKILPEINDDFLKKLGDFASEQDLRVAVRKDLENRELERARNEAYNKAIDILIEKNPFEIPPSRVEHYLDQVFQDVQRYVRPGEQPPTRDDIAQRYREAGIRGIKRYKIIDAIATKENIKPSQDEVDTEIRKMAERYGKPFDELKQMLRQNGTTQRIRADLRERKTLDFLIGEYDPGSADQPQE